MVLSTPLDIIFPPSDLLSDEPPLETERHLRQIILLLTSLEWWRRGRFTQPEQQRQDFFAAGNLSIYYTLSRPKDVRGPDFFVVLDTQYKERKSWMVWAEEGKYPNLILEILSESTAKVDRGIKKRLYQDIFRTPEYFWFDPFSLEFQGFRLQDGATYVEIAPTAQGWFWSQQLQLFLALVEGRLRLLTPEGMLVPTPEEAAIQERQRAETEYQRAEVFAQRLKDLGLDP